MTGVGCKGCMCSAAGTHMRDLFPFWLWCWGSCWTGSTAEGVHLCRVRLHRLQLAQTAVMSWYRQFTSL